MYPTDFELDDLLAYWKDQTKYVLEQSREFQLHQSPPNFLFALRDQLFQHLTKCLKKQSNPITPVPILLKNELLLVLQLLLLLCIDLSRVKFEVKNNHVINIDLFAKMKTVAGMISIQKLQQLIKMLLDTKNILARGVHLNAQLCLENLLIEWERWSIHIATLTCSI